MPGSFSQTLFNSIRNAQDANYQARIPTATQENVAQYGLALSTYTPQYNQFANALIERIGRVIVRAARFENPLARFKRGMNPQAQDMQEIYIEPLKSEGAYNPAGPNPLGRRNPPNISAAYHRMNRQDQYCITLDRTMFMKAFTSWERVDEFVGKLMNAMYTGAAWDEYLCMRELMTNAIKSTATGKTLAKAYLGEIKPKDDASGKALVQGMKYLVNDMKFPRNDMNQAGVTATADASDLVLFVNKDVEPNIDVYTLAGVFNMEKVAYPTRVIPIDTFGVDGVVGVLAHKEWLQCYDTLNTTEPQRNAQGIFTNFFHNVWQTLSLSPYCNAVVLYGTDAPT